LNKAITAAALSATLLIGGATIATGLHKDVRVSVDGESLPGGAFALTVGDLLAAKGITLTAGDEVSPSVDTAISDGDAVDVRFNKPVTLTVDGTERRFFTTATTLDAALTSAALQGELTGSEMSALPTAPVPRDGLEVTVSTPKQVTLEVRGKETELTTTAASVAELLAERNLMADADDKLSPAGDAAITDGQKITLDRVEVSTKVKTEPVKFDTVEKKDSSLWKGESRIVTAGKVGLAKRTYAITEVNGEVTEKKVVNEDVLTKPVDQVRKVGTKVSANGVGINLARAAMWDRIARCESGNNWSINTGNGYYGGLQFNRASWNANGGRDFAALPHQASRAEQITVANRYYAKAGTRPWSCA